MVKINIILSHAKIFFFLTSGVNIENEKDLNILQYLNVVRQL
jgi:hypothetical protein